MDLLQGFPFRQALGFVQQLCVGQAYGFGFQSKAGTTVGAHTHAHALYPLPEEDTIRLPVSNNRAC